MQPVSAFQHDNLISRNIDVEVQSVDMFGIYSAVFLMTLICVLVSLEAEGQSTIDDDSETCDSNLPMSEQVANLIRQGVEIVIASTQQPPSPCSLEASKQHLVSALVCE